MIHYKFYFYKTVAFYINITIAGVLLKLNEAVRVLQIKILLVDM